MEEVKEMMKYILSAAAALTAMGTIYAFADDFIYLQSEADIHLAQDSLRICKEDRAELIDLERYMATLQPPIPSYLYDVLAELQESVAVHCAKRG